MSKDYLLVVDDHVGVRRLLREFLYQEGFCVKEAPDGETALQIVREEKPRLVFLDLKMPGLSGMETLIRLKQLCPQIIVVVISAYTLDNVIKAAVQNGNITYFVDKPFDLQKIRLILHALLSNLNKTNATISDIIPDFLHIDRIG